MASLSLISGPDDRRSGEATHVPQSSNPQIEARTLPHWEGFSPAGLGILTRAEDQHVVETVKQLGNLSGDFSHDKIKQAVDQYDAESSTLDPSKSTDTQSDVKSLVPLAQGLAKEY